MNTDALIAEESSRKRIAGLRKLMGYVENGTSGSVVLCQDDATKTYTVKVGRKDFYGDSFLQALDSAIEAHVDEESYE